MSAPVTVAAFDTSDPDVAAGTIAPACASVRWQRELVDARPYGDLPTLTAASDRTLAQLTWDDVLEALAAHPRIGQRAAGDDVESRWSRSEQSAAATTDASVAARLRERNVAYEARFGWVFLVCATGRTPEEILAAIEARLRHDDATEQEEVREQLRLIVRLRLAKTFDHDAVPAPTGTSVSTHVLDATSGRPAADLSVVLADAAGGVLAERTTDDDGRIGDLAGDLPPGAYRLTFATGSYFDVETFYPEVVVTFRVTAERPHLHVPLLLSPFAYSTYRGS